MNASKFNICVADTGVLIELARLGYLETLKRFKVRVLVPPAVLLELKTIKVPS